jgi:hypothetical protein
MHTPILTDVIKMRAAVLKHPLCVEFVAALRQAGVAEPRIVSLCLGHLDDCALAAARHVLHAAGYTTGLTINDSLHVQRAAPCTRDRIHAALLTPPGTDKSWRGSAHVKPHTPWDIKIP